MCPRKFYSQSEWLQRLNDYVFSADEACNFYCWVNMHSHDALNSLSSPPKRASWPIILLKLLKILGSNELYCNFNITSSHISLRDILQETTKNDNAHYSLFFLFTIGLTLISKKQQLHSHITWALNKKQTIFVQLKKLMITSLTIFKIPVYSHNPLFCVMFTLHLDIWRSGLWYCDVYTHSPELFSKMHAVKL